MRELLKQLNSLGRIPRAVMLLYNVPLGEVKDVAQHAFDVATITFLLADELEHGGGFPWDRDYYCGPRKIPAEKLK